MLYELPAQERLERPEKLKELALLRHFWREEPYRGINSFQRNSYVSIGNHFR